MPDGGGFAGVFKTIWSIQIFGYHIDVSKRDPEATAELYARAEDLKDE